MRAMSFLSNKRGASVSLLRGLELLEFREQQKKEKVSPSFPSSIY